MFRGSANFEGLSTACTGYWFGVCFSPSRGKNDEGFPTSSEGSVASPSFSDRPASPSLAYMIPETPRSPLVNVSDTGMGV